jgi:serine/threonine protein kinase
MGDSSTIGPAGRYRLGDPLGRGYYAEVFRATDRRDGSPWAAKLYAADEPGRAAAKHEAEALRRLAHPRLPAFHDAFEADGRPVVVMALVDGVSLRDRVERDGPLSVAETLRVGAEACELFEYLAGEGWTYRDLHPKNLHPWTPGGTVILDLDGSRPPGRPPAPAGRIGYRAPELEDEAPLTPACDVYSLAGCLFFALTGHDPPHEPGPLPLPGLSAELSALLERCRRAAPGERPPVNDLRRALAPGHP